MTTFSPPHEVCDAAKVGALVEAFRAGVAVPPIVVCGDSALTGSHRVAAYEAAYRSWSRGEEGWEGAEEPTLETVEVSGADYLAALRLLGMDECDDIREYEMFAAALHAVTEDEALRDALADQRGDYESWTAGDFARWAGN